MRAVRRIWFAGMVMTWFQACLIVSGGRHPVGDVWQVVGSVKLGALEIQVWESGTWEC